VNHKFDNNLHEHACGIHQDHKYERKVLASCSYKMALANSTRKVGPHINPNSLLNISNWTGQ